MNHSNYQNSKIGFITWAELRNTPQYKTIRHKLAGLPTEIKPMTTSTKTNKGAYRVLKNSRVATKTTFSSYEQARQWVRSKLRRDIPSTRLNARRSVMWDGISRNPPSISHFGYAIRKVA